MTQIKVDKPFIPVVSIAEGGLMQNLPEAVQGAELSSPTVCQGAAAPTLSCMTLAELTSFSVNERHSEVLAGSVGPGGGEWPLGYTVPKTLLLALRVTRRVAIRD